MKLNNQVFSSLVKLILTFISLFKLKKSLPQRFQGNQIIDYERIKNASIVNFSYSCPRCLTYVPSTKNIWFTYCDLSDNYQRWDVIKSYSSYGKYHIKLTIDETVYLRYYKEYVVDVNNNPDQISFYLLTVNQTGETIFSSTIDNLCMTAPFYIDYSHDDESINFEGLFYSCKIQNYFENQKFLIVPYGYKDYFITVRGLIKFSDNQSTNLSDYKGKFGLKFNFIVGSSIQNVYEADIENDYIEVRLDPTKTYSLEINPNTLNFTLCDPMKLYKFKCKDNPLLTMISYDLVNPQANQLVICIDKS